MRKRKGEDKGKDKEAPLGKKELTLSSTKSSEQAKVAGSAARRRQGVGQ